MSRPTWTTRIFWDAAAERAGKTAGQVFILKAGSVAASDGFDALAADWASIGSWVLGGILLSVAMSLASEKITGDGPSLTGAEVVPDKVWDSATAEWASKSAEAGASQADNGGVR